jgi:DNA-binding transcriptional MerR regulator
VERITRQLRHWTLNHVLEPVGGLHTGPGRHRRYSAESVYMAALIVELSDMGFPIGLLSTVVKGVKFSFTDPRRDGLRLWRRAIEGKGQVLLHFSPRFREDEHLDTPMKLRLVDPKGRFDFSKHEHDSHVIVNLTQLFAPLHV